jgi:hypothetical protein
MRKDGRGFDQAQMNSQENDEPNREVAILDWAVQARPDNVN